MNFRELLRQEKVQERFKREVVADTGDLIDERVDELIDWMVDRNLKQWRAIVEYVERRRQARYDERLIGEVGDRFEYNRGQLLQSVGKNATGVVQHYDRDESPSNWPLLYRAPSPRRLRLRSGPGHRRRRRNPRDDPVSRRDGPDRRRHNRWLRPLRPPEPAPQGAAGVPREDRLVAQTPRRGD